jgi:hypothetical protein
VDKFNRKFRIQIARNDNKGTVEIDPPFSIEFSVMKSTLGSANICNIRIYNLSLKTRESIHRDFLASGENLQAINFFAGYQDNMPLLVSGNVNKCWSVRQGVNIVTNIDCWDAGRAYSGILLDGKPPYPKGTPRKTIIRDLMLELQRRAGVEIGAIGDIQGVINKGYSATGTIIYALQEFTADNFFIENNKSYVLQDDETITGVYRTLDASTGLISTPERAQEFVTVTTVFEPRLRLSQLINLKATTVERYNSQYKIMSIQHSGTISDTISGQATTKIEMLQLQRAKTVLEGG